MRYLTNRVVSLLKTTLILALTGFWALAVNHCRVEAISELGLLTCASPTEESDDHAPNDCEDDSCAVVENGFYKASETYVAVKAPIFVFNPFAGHPCPLPIPSDSFPPCRAASTDSLGLANRWQFLIRAAPSPRAPSRA